MLKSAFLLETRNSFTFDQVDRRIEGRVELLHRCGGGVADDHLQTQGSYNGRILGKKSENQTFALFWSEFGGIFKSLEKFGGI